MAYRAVIFDVGGVVVGSPLTAIANYEREHGIPEGFVNGVVIAGGSGGAWARLERGELVLEAFLPAFDGECAAAGHPISTRELMERVGGATVPRPRVLDAVRRIRARGLLTAALTNNWSSEGDGAGPLRDQFDAFIESSVVGIRKPDPRIYRLACQTLRIAPSEAVFLDDIGRNLKPARELGMRTIKVEDEQAALDELEGILGFPLSDGAPR